MESKVTYKVLERYLDKEFKDAEYIEGYHNKDLIEPWDVLLTPSGQILIGGVVGGGEWFYDGKKLSYLLSLLNISPDDLAIGIKKYIKEKYDLNLKSVY